MNEPTTSLSVIGLFAHADIVVKAVLLLLLLLFGSVWSWAVVVDKWLRLRTARHAARAWIDRAASARGAEELIGEHFGADSSQPASAVIAAGIDECMAAAQDIAETFGERRERIERAMRLALSAQLRLLEYRLPFLATLGSAAPFIGLFGTVWASCAASTRLPPPTAPVSPWSRRASPTRSSPPRWGSPPQFRP